MKKFFTLLIMLTGFVSVACAKTIYFRPTHGDWVVGGERYALNVYGTSDNAWVNFTLEKGVYKAEFDDKYTTMIICRMNGATIDNKWDNRWNQTVDIPWSENNLLYEISGKSDDKYTVSSSSLTSYKIYVKVVDDDFTPYLYSYNYGGKQTNGTWPGTTMDKDTNVGIDHQTWYVYETYDPAPSIIFNKENSDTYKTGDISCNLTSGDAFYFYYPNGSSPKYSSVVRKQISSTPGYATFSSEQTPNFGSLPSGVKAYTLTTSGNAINKTEFTGTLAITQGVLFENTSGSDVVVNLPVWNNPSEVAGNQLVAINTTKAASKLPQEESTNTNFVLTKVGNHVGFYKVYSTGSWVNAGTAYLSVPTTALASRESFWLDEETTGIEAVNNVSTESENVAREYYNLNGQRIMNPTKGLYIVNGKKVIIK